MNQTLEQIRSKYAFEKIKEVKGSNFEKEFSSLVSKLASLILANGLGNTLAFLFAKGKDQHLRAIYILSDWLINQSPLGSKKLQDLNAKNIKEKAQSILENLVLKASVEEYMFYTEESLRLINWLRRYSDAMLEKEENNASEQ
jgi:CRISPR-associated protein Cmr5